MVLTKLVDLLELMVFPGAEDRIPLAAQVAAEEVARPDRKWVLRVQPIQAVAAVQEARLQRETAQSLAEELVVLVLFVSGGLNKERTCNTHSSKTIWLKT